MTKFVFSCEHGGFEIPQLYSASFSGKEDILQSHRGWDRGALDIAKLISQKTNIPLISNSVSRLLIEANRTLAHEELFSEFSHHLPQAVKDELIVNYYLPYRNELEREIEQYLQQQHHVVHLSFHSFTPVLNGKVRETEIGILFDPMKPAEQEYAEAWKKSIEEKAKNWRVKFNYPYKGTDDGLTTYFRAKYKHNYAGLELEVNTKLLDMYSIQQICDWVYPPMIN